MALSNGDLEKHRNVLYAIQPLDQRFLTPLGIDVRPGFVIERETANTLFPVERLTQGNYNKQPAFTIKAKTAVLVITRERVYLSPKLLATLHGRSSITGKGVFVNPVTVDPNWNGRLILHFYNTSEQEVEVPTDDGIATLIFHSLETPTDHHARNSGTHELLRDPDRYGRDVTHKMLKYLNFYESSSEEQRYHSDRRTTKQNFALYEDDISSTEARVERALESAQRASSQQGMATFNENFLKESENAEKAARKWAWLTAVGAGATIAAAALSHIVGGVPESGWQLAGALLTKLSLVAVAATATLWCGRMYKSLMHQAAVNRHKALGLQTFQAFVEATDDPQTRDSVLLATTSSIFAASATGMIDQSASKDSPVQQVVDVGRVVGRTTAPRRPSGETATS